MLLCCSCCLDVCFCFCFVEEKADCRKKPPCCCMSFARCCRGVGQLSLAVRRASTCCRGVGWLMLAVRRASTCCCGVGWLMLVVRRASTCCRCGGGWWCLVLDVVSPYGVGGRAGGGGGSAGLGIFFPTEIACARWRCSTKNRHRRPKLPENFVLSVPPPTSPLRTWCCPVPGFVDEVAPVRHTKSWQPGEMGTWPKGLLGTSNSPTK